MFYQSVYKAVSIAYAGAGTNLVGTRNLIGLSQPKSSIGGACSLGAWSEVDFPRIYAALVRRPVYPVVGNNSEPIRFPTLVDVNKIFWIDYMLGPGSEEVPPRGQYYNQKQRPKPLWFSISGVTQDASSVPLAGCTVKLYRTSDDVEVATTVSDGSGNYSFPTQSGATTTTFYVVAYKAGSPDVAGTTVNTLVAS